MPPTKPLTGREESAPHAVRCSPNDPRWQLARRVAASKSFEKSSFLISFLLYVCEQELCGRGHELNEHEIGVKALGRPATYNPGDDNIVRNYARLLRKRLDEYFQTEGKDEILRVDVPRGHYVPVFSPIESAKDVPLPALLRANPSDTALTGETVLEALPPHASVPGPMQSSGSGDQSNSSSTEAGNARKDSSNRPSTAAHQNSEPVSVVAQRPHSAAPSGIATARSSRRSGRRWLSVTGVLAVVNLALLGILLYGIVWMRSSRPQASSPSLV